MQTAKSWALASPKKTGSDLSRTAHHFEFVTVSATVHLFRFEDTGRFSYTTSISTTKIVFYHHQKEEEKAEIVFCFY